MGSQPTHPQRFGDALLPHQPDRALLTSSPIAVVRNPTARAVTLSVNPRQRRGTSADADAPRSAAADTLQHRIYSGTALRCISPSPL